MKLTGRCQLANVKRLADFYRHSNTEQDRRKYPLKAPGPPTPFLRVIGRQIDLGHMTIHELEHYLSQSSNNPLLSLQSAQSLIPDTLEVCEHTLSDGKVVELTLDRKQGKMIIEVYRDGDLVGEPLNFFIRPVTDALLGSDWIRLAPVEIIQRVLDCEAELRSA